ncbi:type I restriction enzyme HsdR N-terminal domain-containing protein [Paracnuella aquatica]|uniref:type I restriction enzyme HsdR N-terminal domain-containing protein n=1 Tax=Paracnuella aquatica TaxID=2268757 RepID=UPI000DEFD771|nr:type I restriction enzyme HsdR N-terminal domain-containing protein [Paracnuella aquatica]RPD51907.1 type I restriction enzyme HsdR N-terminal domain-containing protein [Paracnuella aquatica]
MIVVDYPAPDFRIKEDGAKKYVFDGLRRSWLLLTPEEWVRQNFVQYLVELLQYPTALIALEKELVLNGLKKRFDVLVYNNTHEPWMLVECKASSVALSAAVLEQALRYNMVLPVSFIVITNGTQTRAWQKTENGLVELDKLPEWNNSY